MGAPLEKRVALASLNRFLDDWIKPVGIESRPGLRDKTSEGRDLIEAER